MLEALLLLLPYAYPHTVIPLVPYYLLRILVDSPSPFLFGTSAFTLASASHAIPPDVHTLFLFSETPIPSPAIPEAPRRWVLHQLSLVDFSLPDALLCSSFQTIIGRFFWQLLPHFSAYLYTFLDGVCFFNNVEYINHEVPEAFRAFYHRLLSTQSFAMFTDQFWLPPNAPLLQLLQSTPPRQHSPSVPHYRITYPPFLFSRPHASASIASSLLHLRSVHLAASPHLLLNAQDYRLLSHTPPIPSSLPSLPTSAFATAASRLLTHYLLDVSPSKFSSIARFRRRCSELSKQVTQQLADKLVRTEFLRLFTQSDALTPYHVLSTPSAEGVALLLNAFYSFCVEQRDFANALRLHKATAVFLVNDPIKRFPLYGYLYTHEIYRKVGFWKELLLDYCHGKGATETAYQMRYKCLSDEEYFRKRKSELITGLGVAFG